MFAFVDHAEAIGLLDKWFLVAVRQQPAMRNGQKTKRSEKIEISGNLAIFPSRFTVHTGARAFYSILRVRGSKEAGAKSVSITMRNTLEESKWEVWLMFLAA